MATRKGVLQLSHENLAIVASFETERMEAEDIEDTPEIVRWDPETDQPVIRQRYVKADHDEVEDTPALPKGTTGYRYVNEDGDEVPSERLVFVQRDPDGNVQQVDKRPSTVLKGETVPIEKWIPLQRVAAFLVDSTYEVWGQDPQDEAELQRLAEWILDNEETPMLVWMLQPHFFKTWGAIVPEFEDDDSEFTLFVKTFRKQMEPAHKMPVLEESEVSKLMEQAEAHFIQQEAPA